ncbi:MAG: hypothetical protein LBD04_06660 [Synergistaceae bacterium]|jgi:hypothetical protein|nr:hypothetical protein [Synergistaceae bacterium]
MPAGSAKTKKPASKASPSNVSAKASSAEAELAKMLKGIPLRDLLDQVNDFLPDLVMELAERLSKIKK